MITKVTRRDLRDLLAGSWAGRFTDHEFLARLYDLEELPSRDDRYLNMLGDIYQHTENNEDWPRDWVFEDSRLEFDDDEKLLRFLAETVHPEVVNRRQDAQPAADAINDLLRSDGFELYQISTMSGRPVFGWRHCDPVPLSNTPESSPTHRLPRLDVTYVKKLGEGAFGTVWLATDTLLDRSMAVKFLTSTNESLDENALLREARSIAKIEHPNLVTVYAAAWLPHPGNGLVAPAILMELINGERLHEWQSRQQSRQQTLTAANGILGGLFAIHQAGLHHGDLHTANVLILSDGTAKIIDWRYQDTFLARPTADRHELMKADQRRAVDLIVTLLDKQQIKELQEIRNDLSFDSVQAVIDGLLNVSTSQPDPSASSDPYVLGELWKQIDSKWTHDWWEKATNYPAYEESAVIRRFEMYLRLRGRPEYTITDSRLSNLHNDFLKEIEHRLTICAREMVPHTDNDLRVASVKEASNRGVHVEDYDQKYDRQINSLTDAADRVWEAWKLYVQELARKHPGIVYAGSAPSAQ